jgi:hypothetical protein
VAAVWSKPLYIPDYLAIANLVKKAGFHWLVHSRVSSMNYRHVSTYRPDTNQQVRLTGGILPVIIDVFQHVNFDVEL